MFRALCAHRQEVKIVLYSTYGVVTPVGGRPVHRLREDWCMGRPPTGVTIPDDV